MLYPVIIYLLEDQFLCFRKTNIRQHLYKSLGFLGKCREYSVQRKKEQEEKSDLQSHKAKTAKEVIYYVRS
jgi:hypothetical protein